MHPVAEENGALEGHEDSVVDVPEARKTEETFLIPANVRHWHHGLVKQRKLIRISPHLSSGKA